MLRRWRENGDTSDVAGAFHGGDGLFWSIASFWPELTASQAPAAAHFAATQFPAPLSLNLAGTDDNDILTGSEDADRIEGGAGDDYLSGGGGDDELEGGAGNDVIDGGDGDDAISDDSGFNIITGGKGDDTIWAYGTENIYYAPGDGNDFIEMAQFGTTLYLTDGLVMDDVAFSISNDQLIMDIADGGSIQVGWINFGNRVDLVFFSDNSFLTWEEILDITQASGFPLSLTLTGTSNNDVLTGSAGDDVISGEAGDDWIAGHAGNDHLAGGDGLDVLEGGEGDDEIFAGAGDDEIYGDDGNDWLHGDAGDDYITGGDGGDDINGGDGNDYIEGNGGGFDDLSGGAGDDVLISGGAHAQLTIMYGNQGDDWLYGSDDGIEFYIYARGDGNDVIAGTSGGLPFGLDQLYFTDGIARSDLSFSIAGNDLRIDIAGMDGGSVTLENWVQDNKMLRSLMVGDDTLYAADINAAAGITPFSFFTPVICAWPPPESLQQQIAAFSGGGSASSLLPSAAYSALTDQLAPPVS